MKKVTLILENGRSMTFDKVTSINYPDKSNEFYFIHQYPKGLSKSTFHIHYSKVFSFVMEEE